MTWSGTTEKPKSMSRSVVTKRNIAALQAEYAEATNKASEAEKS